MGHDVLHHRFWSARGHATGTTTSPDQLAGGLLVLGVALWPVNWSINRASGQGQRTGPADRASGPGDAWFEDVSNLEA